MFRLLRLFTYVALLLALCVLGANVWIVGSTFDRVITDVDELGTYPAALVLGTSPLRADGTTNPFFKHRMEAAAQLYRMGSARRIVASGDNRAKEYNEPMQMRSALMALGAPDSVITLDYAGLRTLDSVVRCKEIFGEDSIVIVTQAFHGYRALFIARYYGIDAFVWPAKDPPGDSGRTIYWREYLARAKALLDLYILKTKPGYMGKRERPAL